MTSRIARWLDPVECPEAAPPLEAMSIATRALHEALDAHARRAGVAYLHPSEPTVQQDLLGSSRVIAWQEGKAAAMLSADRCWSNLPPLYARYGTAATRRLVETLGPLESAAGVLVCDSGMQATAFVFDTLLHPGAHAVLFRQVYNKTRAYLEWLAARVGGTVTVVDDGDHRALEAAIGPQTTLVFGETFTNPLVRAQDLDALGGIVGAARRRAPAVRLVLDSTVATPWAFRAPLLDQGVDVVVASGSKALGGSDRDLWGYIATRDTALANALMDLMAMRGGILDWRRAEAVLAGWEDARTMHERRADSAARIAAFLAAHRRVADVFHPSRPDHPDAGAIRRHYVQHGSIVSFRVAGADEARTRHVADVLAMSGIIRYALSFDGLATKVNHHQTVSEYFTSPAVLARQGCDRLIRLAVGVEAADDLMAALNWGLHRADRLDAADVARWQQRRAAELGCAPTSESSALED